MLVRTDGDHGAGRGAVARAMSASAGPRPLRSDVAAQRVGRPLSRYGAPVSAEDEAAAHIGEVRRFYDRNTARFTGLGQGGASIHRAVYGPGVRSQAEAFHHVEDRLLDLLPAIRGGVPARVVDLGCGVGGSLLHLAGRRPDLIAEGLTISGTQAALAGPLVARAGLADRVRVREGDFGSPPPDLRDHDLAFSIEAFVHGPDPAGYLRAAAGMLRPGGLLAICDDWLTARGAAAAGRDARRVMDFRAGWRIGSLLTVAQAVEVAAGTGFAPVMDDDLTPYLELGRPRDRAVAAMVAVTRPFRPRGEYWRSLAGGDALQQCLRRGLVAYRLLVLRRAVESR